MLGRNAAATVAACFALTVAVGGASTAGAAEVPSDAERVDAVSVGELAKIKKLVANESRILDAPGPKGDHLAYKTQSVSQKMARQDHPLCADEVRHHVFLAFFPRLITCFVSRPTNAASPSGPSSISRTPFSRQ